MINNVRLPQNFEFGGKMYICQQFLGLFKSAAWTYCCCWATQHLFVMISKVRLTHFKCQKRRENSKFYGRWTIFILWTRKIPSLKTWIFSFTNYLNKKGRYPESITNCTQYVTGTFIYIKLLHFQNLMKNECNMRCLWNWQI